MGVRLAVSEHDPLSLYDKSLSIPDGSPNCPTQQEQLIELFRPVEYDGHHCDKTVIERAVDDWLARRGPGKLDFGGVYDRVRSTVLEDRDVTIPSMYEELLASARALAGDDEDQAGELPIMYADAAMKKKAREAAWDRRVLAWKLMEERFRTNPDSFGNSDHLKDLSRKLLLRIVQDSTLDCDGLRQRIETIMHQFKERQNVRPT